MSRYQLTWPLGVGGMATVYEGKRLLPGDCSLPIACKILRPEMCQNREYKQLFYREASLCLQFSHDHPNLVTVHDIFQDSAGHLYMIMELVEGCTLEDLLDDSSTLAVPAVVHILHDALAGLEYIHERDIVHRDISPCNLLLSRSGQVKIADFGLAKILGQGRGRSQMFRGKPRYASPEQLRCHELDARSDLFALAAVIYEVLSGVAPFGDEGDVVAIARRQEHGTLAPLPDSVPPVLREMITGMLAIERAARRPHSAAAARAVVRQLIDSPTASAALLGQLVAPVHRARTETRQTGGTVPSGMPFISGGAVITTGPTVVAPLVATVDAARSGADRDRDGSRTHSAQAPPAPSELRASRPAADPPPRAAAARALVALAALSSAVVLVLFVLGWNSFDSQREGAGSASGWVSAAVPVSPISPISVELAEWAGDICEWTAGSASPSVPQLATRATLSPSSADGAVAPGRVS
ncbi:MAG: serine/threonine-protein kinase, partial [Myxococcota bacterium]